MSFSSIWNRSARWLLAMVIAGVALIITFNTEDSTLLKPVWLLLCSAGLIAIGGGSILAQGNLRVEITASHALITLYGVASLYSLLHATNLRLGWETITMMGCYLVVFWSTYVLIDSIEERDHLLSVIFTVTALACVAGFFLKELRPSSISIFANAERQMISTFGNATYFGGFLAAVIPLLLSKILDTSSKPFSRVILGVLLLGVIYILIQTQTRTAWLAAFLALVVLVLMVSDWSHPRWILLGCVIGFGCIVFFIFQDLFQHRFINLFSMEPTSTFARRMFFYKGAWQAFLASPVLGNGIGNFAVFLPKFRSPEYWIYRSEDIIPHAHNEFLEILSETGIVGFFPWMIVLGYLTYLMMHSLKSSTPPAIVLRGVWCSLLAIILDNFGSMSLRTTPVAVLFWMLVALITRGVDAPKFTISFPLPRSFARLSLVPLVVFGVFVILFIPREMDYVKADAYALEGNLFHFLQNSPEAIPKYEHALVFNPHHANAQFNLSSSLYEQKRYVEARDQALKLLKDYPWFPKAHLLVAVSAGELGDAALALYHFSEELSLRNHPQTYYFLSRLHQKLGHKVEELSAINEMLKQSVRGNEKMFVRYGILRIEKLCRQLEDCQKSISVLQEVAEKFSYDGSILLVLGDVHHSLGLWENAKDFYERAHQLNPHDRDVLARMRMMEVERRERTPSKLLK